MLANALLILAALSFAGSVIILVDFIIGNLSIPNLALEEPSSRVTPRVSIVIAARNEQRDIHSALQSVLRQDYSNYEVIAVDDRSEDSTGAILDEMKVGHPQLVVLHVRELPTGWLGKNYALFQGASVATGSVLLFTDADVVFSSTALSRAIAYMERTGVDHVTAAPWLDIPTIPLSLGVQYFILAFTIYMRPWKARDPKSRYFMGIGAFNLIRREAYEKAGTLARIQLRPDDDIMLGKILKESGAAQHVLNGSGVLRVRWYSSLGELVRGFEKNAFAGMKYSMLMVFGAIVANIAFNIWPFVAVFVTAGITRAFNVGLVFVLMIMYAGGAAMQRNRPWLAPLYPVGVVIFLYIIVRASFRTLSQRGISWRGTHYSLDDLKSNKV